MNEFETYIAKLTNNNALGKEASAPAPAVSAPVQQPVVNTSATPDDSQSKIASIVTNAMETLPEELKEQADALAFMEAYATAKQANFIKSEVQEAMMYPNQNAQQGISAADAAEANALYQAAYKQASMEIAAEIQAQNNSQLNKTASEAQAFIDGIYADVFQSVLAEEAQNWNQLAHQNAGLRY